MPDGSSSLANQSEGEASKIYHPLLDGQFRVIKLLPGDVDDSIHCELEVYRLGTPEQPQKHGCPPYEAISYVWGDPKDTLEIFIGPERQPLRVTRNLLNALKAFRYTDKPRMMWADAICINQADLNERGSQVAQMGGIYSACSGCNVWLGHADEYDLNLAHSQCKSSPYFASGAPSMEDLDIPSIITEPDMESAIRLLDTGQKYAEFEDLDVYDYESFKNVLTERGIGSLINIFARTWWSRLWTAQEVILPLKHRKLVQMFVGSQKIDFKHFLSLDGVRPKVPDFGCLYLYPDSAADLPSTISLMLRILNSLDHAIASLCQFIADSADPEVLTFYLSHMNLLSGRACSDPRDAVYALLGISNGRLIDGLPDFTESMGNCYSRATKTSITRVSDLQHLSKINPVLSSPQRPSWAIDFARGDTDPTLFRPLELRIFPEQTHFHIKSSRGPLEILTVKAYFLSIVSKTVSFSAWDGTFQSLTVMLNTWYQLVVDGGATIHDFTYFLDLESFPGWFSGEHVHELDGKRACDECLEALLLLGIVHGQHRLSPGRDASSWERCPGAEAFLRRMRQLQEAKSAFVIFDHQWTGEAYDCVEPGDVLAALPGLAALCILQPETRGRTLESGYVTSERSYRFLGVSAISPRFFKGRSITDWPLKDIDLV